MPVAQTQDVKHALLPRGTGALESNWDVANFLCFEIRAGEECASPGWPFSNISNNFISSDA